MTSRPFAMRVSAILGATILLTSLLAGTTLAKIPNYGGGAPESPSFVTYGGLVKFDVTWINQSGANLPTVFARADTPSTDKGAAFVQLVQGPSQGSCGTQTAATLSCAFGTVNNGASVSFSAIYRVPSSGASPFNVSFVFKAQGDTDRDPMHSRGDDMPLLGSVVLVSATDERAGSYIIDGVNELVQNNQNLNKRNNPQSEKLDFTGSSIPAVGFGATVSEQAPGQNDCPSTVTTCYGNLVIMAVNGGQSVGGGFLVTVGYTSVPGSATGHFVHWDTFDLTGTFNTISESCDTADPGEECIEDTFKTNGNTFYILRLSKNGPMRGI